MFLFSTVAKNKGSENMKNRALIYQIIVQIFE